MELDHVHNGTAEQRNAAIHAIHVCFDELADCILGDVLTVHVEDVLTPSLEIFRA
jgi:hypothetical protein